MSDAPKQQGHQVRWAVITKMGGRVVVEAETAEAAQEKVERKGYIVLQVSRDFSKRAHSVCERYGGVDLSWQFKQSRQ